jgi:lysophospholipase L1-like esterase
MRRHRGAGVAVLVVVAVSVLAISGYDRGAPASAAGALVDAGHDGTLAAAVTAPHFYVALGDSYSSGEGTYLHDGDYDPGTTKDCHRSDLAWPRMLAADASLDITLANSQSPIAGHIACSGAQTKDIWNAQRPDQAAQLSQLGRLTPRPDLATVTIGGNDAGFADTIEACFVETRPQCDGAISSASAKIAALGNCANNDHAKLTCLRDVYSTIRRQVSTGRLIVVGYPRLFATNFTAYTVHCPWASFGTLGKMNDLIVAMNNQIRAQAAAAGAEYVDVTDALKGHELCTGKSWVRSITVASGYYDTLSAHPLREGQAAIEAIVAGYLRAHPVGRPPA